MLDLYKKDPVSFVWVDKHDEQDLHGQFDGKRFHLVAYKPKRGRYLGYKIADFSSESIRSFVDDLLGGGGEFVKFEGADL